VNSLQKIKLPLSPDTVKLNPHLTGGVSPIIEEGKRVRQSNKPNLNKLETEFLQVLKTYYPGTTINAQNRRYKLGNGIWYKPDFTALIKSCEFAWEVKGPHAFRGGIENLKVVAACWPDVVWILIWKESGNWKQQKILA
jgi:hypothetical protein